MVAVPCRNSPLETVTPNTAAMSMPSPFRVSIAVSPAAVSRGGGAMCPDPPALAAPRIVTSAVSPAAVARRPSGSRVVRSFSSSVRIDRFIGAPPLRLWLP